MKFSGRFKKLLTAAARLLWADEQPGANIAPDGGPGPYFGPYPWEIPGPDLSVDKLPGKPTGWADPDSDPVGDLCADLRRAEDEYRNRVELRP